MKYLIYIFTIILLVGVNLGLFNNLQFFGQIPNLLLLFTLCTSLEKKNYDFFFVAFFSGVFLDFYSASFFGSFTIGLLLVAVFLNILVNVFVVLELNWKTLSSLLVFAMLLLNLFLWLYGLIVFKLHWASDFIEFKTFAGAFLQTLFYNLLFLYPIVLFYNFIRKLIDNLSLRRTRVIN